MTKKYIATKEEYEAIKEIIEDIFQLWYHDFISADNGHGASISMSKETFFEQLKRSLGVEEEI